MNHIYLSALIFFGNYFLVVLSESCVMKWRENVDLSKRN